MDFAYAQGIIEVLKNSDIKANIKWSGYRAAVRYIVAPENGGSGSVNPADWKQIWQYGSDLNQSGADPMWEQDGVAPQFRVKGLENTTNKSGRAYIPKNQNIPKGFVESHSIGNYGWIFGLNSNANGYVSPR